MICHKIGFYRNVHFGIIVTLVTFGKLSKLRKFALICKTFVHSKGFEAIGPN